MRKDRIVEITGLAILLIQRLYGKDYKNAVVTFYLLFVIAILDREITEENIFELAVWTMAELAVGIAIATFFKSADERIFWIYSFFGTRTL